MKKNSIVLIVALVVLIALYFLISSSLKNNEESLVNEDAELNGGTELIEEEFNGGVEDEAVFCTMDAMECPDGSFVGRVAPDCEFASCPVSETIVIEEEVATPELIDEQIFIEEEVAAPEMIELIVE